MAVLRALLYLIAVALLVVVWAMSPKERLVALAGALALLAFALPAIVAA